MFKKIFLCVALMIPMLASAQNLKIGLVDANDVIQSMPELQNVQTRLKEASDKYEAEFKKLQDEFQRKYEEYEKQSETALPAIKQRMESELMEYQNRIQKFQQDAQTDLQNLQGQLMQPVIQKVRDAINTVGKEGGYSLVQGLEDGLVFYYSAPVVNITDEVKAKLGIKK